MTTKPEAIAQIDAAQYQVKGLREGQRHDYTTGDCLDMSGSMDEAADSIENLLANIAAQDADLAAEREKVRVLREALEGMVEIAELTIGWLPTPPNADGPLIVARAALTQTGAEK